MATSPKRRRERRKDDKTKTKPKSLKDAKAKPKSIKDAFDASNEINSKQQALFLTYVKGAVKAKDEEHANAAAKILQDYKQSSNEQKKGMVINFFKNGARKSGLAAVFRKVVATTQKAGERAWQGWASVASIMEFHKVRTPPSPPKWWGSENDKSLRSAKTSWSVFV